MNYWLEFFLIGLSVAATDVCWAYYFIKVSKGQAVSSAIFATGIIGLGGISIMAYAEEPSFLIASMIGAFIGTYGTVKFEKYINSTKEIPSDVNEELEEEKFVKIGLDNIKGETINELKEKHGLKVIPITDEMNSLCGKLHIDQDIIIGTYGNPDILTNKDLNELQKVIEFKKEVQGDWENAKQFDEPAQINVDAKWDDTILFNEFMSRFIYTSGRIWQEGDLIHQGQLFIDVGDEYQFEYINIDYHDDEIGVLYDVVNKDNPLVAMFLDQHVTHLRLKV